MRVKIRSMKANQAPRGVLESNEHSEEEPGTKLRPSDVGALIGKSISGVYSQRKNDPAFDRLFIKLSPRHVYVERQALDRYLSSKALESRIAADAPRT
jgi:hypothetical protein